MLPRLLAAKLRRVARQFPVLTLTGPRQSGKTTLARAAFPRHAYASLEPTDVREFALHDPRGFLAQFPGPVILDEAQRAPNLFSYIQTEVDQHRQPGRYVITGSENFLLTAKISQSLAGRCAVQHLLPLSLPELLRRRVSPIANLGKLPPAPPRRPRGRSLFDILFAGFYPAIHDRRIDPQEWLRSYYLTYVERDVRSVLNIGDLDTFSRFVQLCAGRSGQILNLSALASDCGVTHSTASRWISVLEAGFIVTLLRPHFRNFGKRLIKNPKLYFLDTGLLCYLLRIQSPEDLQQHPSRGAVFETFVLSELYKDAFNRGEQPHLYFWRDSTGHEVDFLADLGKSLLPIEVKSGQTIAGDFFDGLLYWRELAGQPAAPAALIYGGDKCFLQKDIAVHSWFNV